MLVKISKKYCGTLGIFNEDTNSVIQKDKTSAPFELDDALALCHLKSGILVTADAADDELSVEEPAMAEENSVTLEDPQDSEADDIPEEIPDGIPSEVPEGIPEDLPIDEDDLDSITDYKVLKSMAKRAGINPFGKNKDELRAAIREANS